MKNLSIRQIKCLITLILAVFLCGAPAVAQTQKIAVKLDMTKVPMKTVMNEIEKQTKYLFLYTDEIDTKRIVSIKADSKPLNEVLPLLFKDTDITYEITVPNIVLSKRVAAARPSAISGVVKDSGGLGIIGATVLIKGTTVGTTTGIDGDFALTVPASVDNPELSVSFIGYETRVVPIGSRTTFDITLANSSIEVEQVVVTALGIKRAEKALSYNVQQVNSDAITANKDANFINSLNGKVAGVNINASSAGEVHFADLQCALRDRRRADVHQSPGGRHRVQFAGYDRSHCGHQPRGHRVDFRTDGCCGSCIVWLGRGQRRHRRDNEKGTGGAALRHCDGRC